MNGLFAFCEFQQYGPERGFLSPCREFAFVTISHLVIILFALIAFVQNFSTHVQINELDGRTALSLVSAICSTFSAAAIICQIIIQFSPFHKMPFVLLICYSLATVVWSINAATHFLSFFKKRRIALLPFVPSAISVLVFTLVSAQRWISFGPTDPRTLLTFFLTVLQSLSMMLPIFANDVTIPVMNNSNNNHWSRLDEETMEGVSQMDNRLVYHERAQTNWVAYIFSELFFCWTNPLVQKGYRRELKQVEDVFELPPSLDLISLERVLLPSVHNSALTVDSHSEADEFSFAHILLRVYGRQFFLLGLIRLIGDIFKFANPILLHLLITALQEPVSLRTGYLCAFLMFLTMIVSSACDFHFGYLINMLTLRAKTALLLAVYEKLLHIPAHRLSGDFSSGNLINLMCTDVDRIGGFITSFHAFWSMPLNFAIALYLLYREIGLAFLAGLAVSVFLIPLNKYIAQKIGQFWTKMMQMKDARMKLVSELSHSMRTVKLNNWEHFFEAKINAIREKELSHLKAIKYLDAVCVYLWASAPIVITVLMLGTYTAMHEQLTAARVFTTLALINIIIMPLNAFPWVLSSIIKGLVSKRRFDSFFAIKSVEPDQQKSFITVEEEESSARMLIELQQEIAFGWTEEGQPAVSGLHFEGKKGALIGVVGPVGSGKSTMLLGLLNETVAHGPPIRIGRHLMEQGFAYVGQDVWLREGTIRDNILCESPFRPEAFQSAIEACALSLDIRDMPGQENYRISGEGVTLSGGQRVRLALARAIYADKQCYLLDDPFAALDRNVARFIYENCIERTLRARAKLIILCTHHEEYLATADLVIRLGRDGRVQQIGWENGSPEQVLAANQQQSNNGDLMALKIGDEAVDDSPMEAAEHVGPEEGVEEKEEGAVKLDVYRSYARAIGPVLSGLILLAILAMQTTKNGSDIWLSHWASADPTGNQSSGEELMKQDWSYPLGHRPVLRISSIEQEGRTNFYLFIYVSIAGLNSLCTLIRAFLFAFGCILAARRLHSRVLTRLFRASISWWDQTPCGRVTNRLSSDVAMVDDALPFQLNICLASLFSLIGTLLITLVALPLLIPLILLLFPVYFFIQKYYRRTTVELKRITALSLSPLYSHLAETMSGLVTIRALRITDKFSALMRRRLAQNLRAQFSSLACSQWLSVRIQMLGIFMVTVIAVASVLDVSLFKLASPGLVGLAITYAMSFTGLLNGLLSAFIETEKELVSVERICDYVDNVPAEGGGPEEEVKEEIGQIMCRHIVGQIRFTGISLRYGPELPLAIRDVSFNIGAGQRVAIIGRTGSGKSTVLQALLRAHPIETGKIHIDEHIDLHSVGLHSARSMFGFVSQQPFLFTGTLRENLCISYDDAVDDQQIEAVIADAGLLQWLTQFGGLDAPIQEGGRSLSFGERQLISLLRLALGRPKIILIDEATAHMDERTHLLMGRLIGQMGCTVLAIIHRLAGLDKDYDWVIEMSGGQIARQGPPTMFTAQYQPHN